MKRNFVLVALMLMLAAAAVSAQDKKPDFSGSWEFDTAKSKLGERMRVESMTMTVAQTATDLKVETNTKRAARPEGDAPNAGRPGGGMGRGGMMGGGTQSASYALDGKETTVEQESPMGKMPVKTKAKMESDGKLKLNSSRTFTSPMGEVSISTEETWTLSPDGKMLTVARQQTTPRGSMASELVFVKK